MCLTNSHCDTGFCSQLEWQYSISRCCWHFKLCILVPQQHNLNPTEYWYQLTLAVDLILTLNFSHLSLQATFNQISLFNNVGLQWWMSFSSNASFPGDCDHHCHLSLIKPCFILNWKLSDQTPLYYKWWCIHLLMNSKYLTKSVSTTIRPEQFTQRFIISTSTVQKMIITWLKFSDLVSDSPKIVVVITVLWSKRQSNKLRIQNTIN